MTSEELIRIEAQDEECGDECVIDTEALKARRAQQGEAQGGNGQALLILLTQGTYGHHDDGFSAIQVGNAVLSVEQGATMLLLDDGVYFGVKNQDPTARGLPNNLNYLRDFLDLGGRMLALDSSMRRRGLAQEDLAEGVEVIDGARLVREVESHKASVTF